MRKSIALALLLSFLPATSAQARMISPSQPVQAVTPQGAAATRGVTSSLAEDKTLVLWRDMEKVGIEDGQIRDMRLKPGVKIPRSQFFVLYGASLGLDSNYQMTETVNRPDKWGFVESRFTPI
jgi:hypothetical protein